MPFLILLAQIAKVVLEVKKFSTLLSGLASGKLVESLIGSIVVGKVVGGLVKAGLPIDHLDFRPQARLWLEHAIKEAGGDLAKHGIIPDMLHGLMELETALLLEGKSIGNGKEPTRNQRQSADPILLHKGEFERTSIDLKLNCAGVNLEFRRVYRSGADFVGPIGRAWDHSFNLRLIENNADRITQLTGDLSLLTFLRHPRFGQDGFTYFAPLFATHNVLIPTLSGSYTLLHPGGRSTEFERVSANEHRATLIRDLAGNTLELKYDTDDRLERVLGNGQYRYLHLTYDSANRISRVTDHSGRECSYAYDDAGYLCSCSQWIDLGGKRHLSAEEYQYTRVFQSRRLARILDESGHTTVENVYDTSLVSDTLGYVIEQVTDGGPTHFVYETLTGAAPLELHYSDEPQMRVLERGPSGHVIERWFNSAGNELLRSEDFVDGQRQRTATSRVRYNPDGALITYMDSEGGLKQYLYEREHCDADSLVPGAASPMLGWTQSDRLAMGNLLATIERGKRVLPHLRRVDQSEWIAALPALKLRHSVTDGITKFVYDVRTQLVVSQSDPLHTHSSDPFHVESAPPGTPSYNPTSSLAIRHNKHQVRYEYTNSGLLSQTVYPGRTRPPAVGPSLPATHESIVHRDAKGRITERMDRHGYSWYVEYYPETANPAEAAWAGFPKRELRPHADFVLNEDTEDVLEVVRSGPWLRTATAMIATDGVAAEIQCAFEGARFELWQSADGLVISGHPNVSVSLDGIPHGIWAQTTQSRYVIAELSNGVHSITLRSASHTPFSIGRIVSHTSVEFQVDELGRVVKEVDGRGGKMETTYDTLDRVIRTTRGGGLERSDVGFTFSANGHLIKESAQWRDHDGNPLKTGAIVRQYCYTLRGLLARQRWGVRSDERTTTYRYGVLSQPMEIKDGRGVRHTFKYDALGRRIWVTRAACTNDEARSVSTYDLCGRLLSERDSIGAVTVMGRVTPGMPIISGYDARGRLGVVTDALGHVSLTQYDLAGREVVKSRFARRPTGTYDLVHRIEYGRDEYGDINQQAVAVIVKPIATANPFDAPDAEFLAVRSAGMVAEAVTLYRLDEVGRQIAVLDPIGGLTERRFDAHGRTVEERLPNGRRIARVYDASGNLKRVYTFDDRHAPSEGLQGAAVVVEDLEYDALNRKVVQRDSFGNEWRYGYDSVGNLSLIQEPDGTITAFERNPFGEETKRSEGRSTTVAPIETARRYDQSGNLILIVDPLGREYRSTYDYLNRLKATQDSSDVPVRTSTYRYNRASWLIRFTDRNGAIEYHSHDKLGRRIHTDFDWSGVQSAHAPSPLSPTYITLEYDALGRITRHESDWAYGAISRDSRGLTREEQVVVSASNGIAGYTWRVAQDYDLAGNRTKLLFPSGRMVEYAYDAAGRMTSARNTVTPATYVGSNLTSGAATLARIEYAGARWRRTFFTPAQVVLTVTYEGRDYICQRSATDQVTGTPIWQSQLFLDSCRRAALETSSTANGSRSRYFHRDRVGRLTAYRDGPAAWVNTAAVEIASQSKNPLQTTSQATINAAIQSSPPITTAVFFYDSIGNRLVAAEPSLAPVPYQPDIGNRYVTVDGAAWEYDLAGRLLSDQQRDFRYTCDGFLTEERERSTGILKAGLVRDALGRVLASNTDAGVHYFGYADGKPVCGLGPNGLAEYTPGPPGHGVLHIAGGGHDYWLVLDAVRSPRVVVQRGPTTANVLYSYRPFGQSEGPQSPEHIHAYGGMLHFPGSTALLSMLRAYRPDVGRFMQQDPAGFVDGTNRYVYASNNPIDRFDPLGLQAVPPDALPAEVLKTREEHGQWWSVVLPDGTIEFYDNKIRDVLSFERNRPVPETHIHNASREFHEAQIKESRREKFGWEAFKEGITHLDWYIFGQPTEPELIPVVGGAVIGPPAGLLESTVARTTELHKLAGGPAKFRNFSPTVSLVVQEGPVLVTRGPTSRLSLVQREALITPREVEVRMRPDIHVARAHRIHPDMRVLVHATLRGFRPRILAVAGRTFCPFCIEGIEAFGGEVVLEGEEFGAAIFTE